jgi:glycosyltransferase involved in cell wall biosynthesis
MVAVIIPAFRCEKTITATLDSVLAQRRAVDFVVIVLDEPNLTLETICREHEIKAEVLINKDNLGVAATRNIGFDHVKDKADYICFLDSDDVLHQDFIFTACAQYDSAPDTDAVFGNFLHWHDETDQAPLPSMSTESGAVLEDALSSYLSRTGGYLLSFALINKSSIVAKSVDGKVNIEYLRSNEDFEFICRLFFQGKVIRIDGCCGWHKKMPGSLSSNQVNAWNFRSEAAKLLYVWLRSRNAEKSLLSEMKLIQHSATRRCARLLWKQGNRKQATQKLLKSISRLQWKSFAQLLVLFLGVGSRVTEK